MSKLIPPERCFLPPYWTKEWWNWKHAGVIQVTPHKSSPWPPHPPYNPLCAIAITGMVDVGQGLEELLMVPVKINREPGLFTFDTEKGDPVELNKSPALIYFMGNDDWSYGLRFSTFEERDAMLSEFGEELGFCGDLQGHN